MYKLFIYIYKKQTKKNNTFHKDFFFYPLYVK